MKTKKYVVWVGGIEVNDFALTLKQAQRLKSEYIDDGYNDVYIDLY